MDKALSKPHSYGKGVSFVCVGLETKAVDLLMLLDDNYSSYSSLNGSPISFIQMLNCNDREHTVSLIVSLQTSFELG